MNNTVRLRWNLVIVEYFVKLWYAFCMLKNFEIRDTILERLNYLCIIFWEHINQNYLLN